MARQITATIRRKCTNNTKDIRAQIRLCNVPLKTNIKTLKKQINSSKQPILDDKFLLEVNN